ncbi:MAG TPA: AI-2E family transporter [Azospirillaceae bacterium]|nr:AI-2E family transporter [Azospirillaceae bacterium]
MSDLEMGRPVRSAAPSAKPSSAATWALLVVLVGLLYVGQPILVPLALGVLISFVLAPLAYRMERLRLGRVPSAVLAVLLAVGVLVGIGTVLAGQLVDLAGNLPRYEENLRAKIRSLGALSPGGGLMAQTSEVIKDLGAELQEATGGDKPQDGRASREPVPVRIEPPPSTPFSVLRNFGGPVLAPLGTAGVVFIFVVFILLQRDDLRDRLIRLAGARDLHRTTEAMNEAAYRVSRYLVMQLAINVAYGIPVGIGLWLIGVPNPILWAGLATVLRFVPYLGPVVGATLPIALSFAVDPGWSMPLMTMGLFLVLELFSNNVMEPWLYGSSTGLSPFAVILAAIFWTTLWGPVGLLLATPLTVCLVVLGRYVPQLEFLDVLLGNAPALSLPARIYQRLLARDPIEAAHAVDDASSDHGAAPPYDDTVIPALRMADGDRMRGELEDATLTAIRDGVASMVDYLSEPSPEEDSRPSRVLCIAARSKLDEAAALLLADLLTRENIPSEALPCEEVHTRRLRSRPRTGVDALVLSYLNPGSGRHSARLVRRLRAHFGPGVQILVGYWGGAMEGQPLPSADGADAVPIRLEEARERLRFLAASQPAAGGADRPALLQPGRTQDRPEGGLAASGE